MGPCFQIMDDSVMEVDSHNHGAGISVTNDDDSVHELVVNAVIVSVVLLSL